MLKKKKKSHTISQHRSPGRIFPVSKPAPRHVLAHHKAVPDNSVSLAQHGHVPWVTSSWISIIHTNIITDLYDS